jgi:hypothetical protein
MIELLQLGNGEGWSQLRSAVEQALGSGYHFAILSRHDTATLKLQHIRSA